MDVAEAPVAKKDEKWKVNVESVDVANRFYRYKSDVTITWEADEPTEKVNVATEVVRAEKIMEMESDDEAKPAELYGYGAIYTGGALPTDSINFSNKKVSFVAGPVVPDLKPGMFVCLCFIFLYFCILF